MSISLKGPVYNVIRFSPTTTTRGKNLHYSIQFLYWHFQNFFFLDESGKEKKLSMFDQAEVVASVPSRWTLNPSYMHTFGMTENYYIIIEQPWAVNLITSMFSQFKSFPMAHCLKWHENENVSFP